MNVYLFDMLIAAWWILGSILYIHDLRRDIDITLGWVVSSIIMGFGGPLWGIPILFRKIPKVILKKYDKR